MQRQKRINKQRERRAFHTRKRVQGDAVRPRLTVHRSNKHIYAQLIDDERGVTICASSSRVLCGEYGGTVEHAKKVGLDVAEKAQALNIKAIKFDRGSYRYHGRVRALADAAREKGLVF